MNLLRTIILGLRNIQSHKLRSGLTVLGIVFGVGAVIAMLAITKGANQEALAQIESLGSQNIIIRSIPPPKDPSSSRQQRGPMPELQDYGLRYTDAERLNEVLPSLRVIVPIKALQVTARYQANEQESSVLGTVPWQQDSSNLRILRGRFITEIDLHDSANVCVLSEQTARKLFQFREPLDKAVRIGNYAYRVIGIVGEVGGSGAATADLPSSSADIYVPLTTLRAYQGDLFWDLAGGGKSEYVELHQLIIMVNHLEEVVPTARVVKDVLDRYHKNPDYEIIVPLDLLEKAKRTQAIFSIVFGSIAAISLLVGGIGIMNIMLASVSERTREIGIRRALGARRHDILLQFLIECMILAVGGGIVGMGVGALLPQIVTYFFKMPSILSPMAFLVSFSVSAAVGIVFGLYPARRASMMDPIQALHHE